MSSRRPPRPPGNAPRGPGLSSSGGADDTPAQTNLGLLLQRALEAAQQSAQPPQLEQAEAPEEGAEARGTRLCADCWHALTFRDERGRQMARCGLDLWARPAFTYQELNDHKVRRWYADCPAYDDSE